MYAILNKCKVKSASNILYELKKNDILAHLAIIKSCKDIKTTNNKYSKKADFRDLKKVISEYEALKN